MSEHGGNAELIVGFGSLLEYLDHRANFFRESVISYQTSLNEMEKGKKFGDKEATQRIIDREKEGYERYIDAQNMLHQGDNSKALILLREGQEELKSRIEHNRKYGNLERAQEVNSTLVLLQMLESDATGIKPIAYGMRLSDNEPFATPESVKRSDLVTASLFKTILSFERNKELVSGMMYRPSSERILKSFDELLSFDMVKNLLTDQELERIKKQIQDIFSAIDEFSNTHLKVGYDKSYPSSPYKGTKPQEVMRLRKANSKSLTPNVLVYMENSGELKYRYSTEEKKLKQVFDLEENSDGIEVGIICRIEPFSQEIEDKVATLLKSSELKTHWHALQKNRELTTIPINL